MPTLVPALDRIIGKESIDPRQTGTCSKVSSLFPCVSAMSDSGNTFVANNLKTLLEANLLIAVVGF